MYFSKIKKITFGKNVAFKIKDYKHVKVIINKLYDFLITNEKKYIRVTNKADLAYIKQNKYQVAPNFVGKEAFYFFCKINSNLYNVVIFKEELRKNIQEINFNYIQIYKIKFNVPKSFYNGTLFDGVIFNKTNSTFFVINDLVVFDGQITNIPLQNKQEIMNQLINHINVNKFFNIMINQFYDIDFIKTLYYDKIKNSHFDINGMIFMDPSKNNTVFNIYSNNIHTKSINAVFNMKKENLTDVYTLECLHDGELKKWGIARIPNMKKSLFFQNIFKNKDNMKVECIYNLRFNKWEPVQLLHESTPLSNFNYLKKNIQQII